MLEVATWKSHKNLFLNTLAFTVCFAAWMFNGVLVTFLVDNQVFNWGPVEDRLAVRDSGPDRVAVPSAGRDADRQVRRQAGLRHAADSLRHPDVPAFQSRQLYLVRSLQFRLRYGRSQLFHRHRFHLGLVSPRAAGNGAGNLRRRQCRGGPDHAVRSDHAQQADQQRRQHRGVARSAGLLRADPGGHGRDLLHLQRQQETGQFRQILHRRC